MYKRGDRVLVEGFGGDKAVLRVWSVYQYGLALCSEENYQQAVLGAEADALIFPMKDIKGNADSVGQPTGA